MWARSRAAQSRFPFWIRALIYADGAKIGGYLLFRNKGDVRFRAAGTVRLFGSNIGGGLECDGGLFEKPQKPDGQALNFGHAQIGRSVLLTRVGGQPFTARGTVNFQGAQIGAGR